ncbi:MAG: MotA/TolQ/ExbB proton channel family protein [Pseudodesulfovibrio sp.]|nr:MotA/TolQ/ExbB proton channel family protein [Pseudodesulfovibrio sp.]
MMLHDLAERLTTHFQAGGEIMIPLLLISVGMWTLSIVKFRRFLQDKRREIPPAECISVFKDKGAICKTGLPLWQWDILSQYMQNRCDDPELNREMLESMRTRQGTKVMRHIGTILILAAVAPLLGLLGTVTGMISTFDVISTFGTGNARALASGISEALVTTQSGLVIAVPGLLLGSLLYRRAEKTKTRMELFCIGLQNATDGQSIIRE